MDPYNIGDSTLLFLYISWISIYNITGENISDQMLYSATKAVSFLLASSPEAKGIVIGLVCLSVCMYAQLKLCIVDWGQIFTKGVVFLKNDLDRDSQISV